MAATTSTPIKPTSRAIQAYILFAVLYLLLTSLLPPNKATMRQYHLTAIEYHVLLFALILPSLAAWFAAFFSYGRLKEYATAIARFTEGADFQQLARGSGWLALSLPIPALVSTILEAIANSHGGFQPTAIIIINYTSLLIPLVAFSVIGVASRGLIRQAKVQLSLANARSLILLFVTAGVLFCYFTFQHLNLHSLSASNNPYYLPAWLMVLTIIIPYLYAWFVGLLAAYEITSYSKHVRGLLYKQPLRLVAYGLMAVIVSSVALLYLNTVEPRLGYLVLDSKLAITTSFRVIGGIGFVIIAVGAHRLKKIEEI